MTEQREAFVKQFTETTKAAGIARAEREEFTAAVSNFVSGYLKSSTIGAMDVAEGLSNVAQNIYRTFKECSTGPEQGQLNTVLRGY